MVLRKEQEIFVCQQWENDNAVTAAKIKEEMESRFRGKEEMLLMEFEIQKVLQRIYRRLSNGKQPCGANESDDEPESDNEEGHEEEV